MLVSQTNEASQNGQANESASSSPGLTLDTIEFDSIGLLQGQREIRIRHGNEYYRLRHTRNDKLILTK